MDPELRSILLDNDAELCFDGNGACAQEPYVAVCYFREFDGRRVPLSSTLESLQTDAGFSESQLIGLLRRLLVRSCTRRSVPPEHGKPEGLVSPNEWAVALYVAKRFFPHCPKTLARVAAIAAAWEAWASSVGRANQIANIRGLVGQAA